MRAHRSRSWLTIALAFVGAFAFASSAQLGWWSLAEVEIGPFGGRACLASDCRETDLNFVGGSDLWLRSAVATRSAIWIVMFLLVLLAGAVAAERIPRLVARTSLVALATALVCGGYFFVAFPGVAGATSSTGLGAPAFGAGVVLGVAAAVRVLRAKQA
jgi:hypothetical protein